VLKQSLDAIAELITDAEFVVNEYGLSLKAIDPSQIALVVYNLPRDSFEDFKITGQKKLGLNIPSLQQIIRRAKPEDKVILEVGTNKRFNVTLQGTTKRSFSINLLDLSNSELPNPSINYDVFIKVRAPVLADGVKDAALFASYLTLKIDNENIIISTTSTKGELNSETSLTSVEVLDKDIKNEARSIYSIDFLESLLKGATNDTELEIYLKTDAPLKLKYKIQESTIQYFLAPRIEEWAECQVWIYAHKVRRNVKQASNSERVT